MRITTDVACNAVWHFSKPELVALLAHMSRDETRASQWCLVLDPSQGRAHATDGHRVITVTTQDRAALAWDSTRDAIIQVPRFLVEEAAKACVRGGEVTFARDGSACVATTSGKAARAEFLTDWSPKLDHVIPPIRTVANGCAAGFNAGYLADVALAVAACPPTFHDLPKGKKEKIVPFVIARPPPNKLDPMRFDVACPANQSHWTVVLMPVRT